MTPEHIDRVFGRGRLKMVTGAHVEVFREAAAPGESRRYTKRFLTTADGDYAQWTEREWRILARLIGHGTRCIPDVVQYDRGAHGTKLVQTYDAGATVDQWATLLPVERDGRVYTNVFEDCAHWWALAHHCLDALDEIHSLELVHLDIKGDNICIPVGPANFDAAAPAQRLFPEFRKLALIDFAFSLVSGETLTTPLPIGWQHDYDYQSPRLLHALEAGRMGDLAPTENLDWRCDMYSLAAMLKRYLPSEQRLYEPDRACGWTEERLEAAKLLVLRLRESHDRDLTSRRAHAELLAETSAQVRDSELAQSLERGWTLAHDAQPAAAQALPPTPVTRLARPVRLVIPPRDDLLVGRVTTQVTGDRRPRQPSTSERRSVVAFAVAASAAALAIAPFVTGQSEWLDAATERLVEGGRVLAASLRSLVSPDAPVSTPSQQATAEADRPAAERDAIAPTSKRDPEIGSTQDAPTAESEPQAANGTGTSIPDAKSTAKAPPRTSGVGPASSVPATSPAKRTDESFAAQIEAHRGKALPRTTRAPSSTVTTASRAAAAARIAEASRRAQLASAKSARSSATAAVAGRSPPAAAPKKTGGAGALAASSRMPAISRAVATAPTSPAPTSVAPTSVAPTPTTPTTPALVAGTPVQPSVKFDAIAVPPGAQPSTTTSASGVPAAGAIAVVPSPSTAAPAAASEARAPSAPSRVVDVSRAAMPSADPLADFATVQRSGTIASAPPSAPIVDASRQADGVVPATRQAAPAATADAQKPTTPPVSAREGDPYHAQARWTLEHVLPRTSEQSRAQVTRVLALAATAYHPMQERAVADAAASSGAGADAPYMARDIEPASARRFHEEARRAYWTRRQVAEALDLELKAFGANPNDAEIAGHLAFLHLKIAPVQAERARQLALHAIGMRSEHYPTGRPDDWTTFAIASALTGRSTDARHALYASLALTRNADRVCRAAVAALSIYGERLREPVEALLYRVHTQGRSDDSPYCAWPANRIARYQ